MFNILCNNEQLLLQSVESIAHLSFPNIFVYPLPLFYYI